TPYQAPRTEVEETLAAIWADVLQRDPIGRDDVFFELGESLLAARLLARVKETFMEEVGLPDFYAAPTVAGLAEVLIARETAPGRVKAIARLRQEIDTLLPSQIEEMLSARLARG